MQIDELKTLFEKEFPNRFLRSITDLSNNLVEDNQLAYSFDDIKCYYPQRLQVSSADALYIAADRVYLIEFKRGFIEPESDKSAKKEAQRRAIRLKACESYLFLEKVICDGNELEFKKTYMAVIDGKDDVKGVMAEFFGERNNEHKTYSEKSKLFHDLTCNSLLLYRKQIGGKWIMYDDIMVKYAYEFTI